LSRAFLSTGALHAQRGRRDHLATPATKAYPSPGIIERFTAHESFTCINDHHRTALITCRAAPCTHPSEENILLLQKNQRLSKKRTWGFFKKREAFRFWTKFALKA